MSTKVFSSEDGREWMVTKIGSLLTVTGEREQEEKLYEIARSCAYNLGISSTRSGLPLEHVNEHRRIWSTIWDKGKDKLPVVPGVSRG